MTVFQRGNLSGCFEAGSKYDPQQGPTSSSSGRHHNRVYQPASLMNRVHGLVILETFDKDLDVIKRILSFKFPLNNTNLTLNISS